MVGFAPAADDSSAAAAKARNNGWVGRENRRDHPGRNMGHRELPPIKAQSSDERPHGLLAKADFYLQRMWSQSLSRVRSLGKASKAVVTRPHQSILVTKERKAEKRRLKARQRPKRIHFKLPKQRGAPLIKALEPKAKSVHRWLMFMVLPQAFEMWAFPYRLGFGSPGGGNQFILTSDIVCDCIFLIDAVFGFFIQIPANTYPGQPDSIKRIRQIAPERVKRDFPTLFIPAIIYYVATVAVSDTYSGRWIWWVATLPRMCTRLYRLLRYFRCMETNLDISVRTLQAVKFLLIIFLSCHWVGCISFFLSRLHSFDNSTWVADFEVLLPLYHTHNTAPALHYLVCLYKGFNGLSNLGFDHGLPQNAPEMVWALCVMGFQVYLSALILGTLLNFLVSKDPVAEAYKKKVDDLGLFIEAKQLPADLRDRILKHMQFQYEKNVLTKEAASLSLPHSLRVKVADAKYRGIINKCTIRGKPLNGCNPQFINTVMTKLTVMHVMAGEELTKKGDIPRELYFVLDGTLHVIDDDNRVKSVIRNDVPDMAPIAGEVPFFLGINHMSNIRARPDGSVQLLKLSKEDSIEIFGVYPEEFDIICGNLLAKYDLDLKGQPSNGGGEEGGEMDADTVELKKSVMESMKSRRERRFISLLQSAANGDVEAVQLAIRQGAEIDQRNYDGRSILHMASADGNYKMVEMLLEQGADKDCRDRWGRTPLAEAILNRQALVAGLLAQYKGSLAMENPAGALCEFAGAGDVEQVRRLVENKIDPDESDYDGRCALHISSAEGHDKVVEYLLSKRANPNATDRWGGTPLLDAVRNGHVVAASLLRAKGAKMPRLVGTDEVCGAAGNGDVKKLRLLHDCGEAMDVCDYDSRYPLHLASAEARILAVSFLLGISTDPCCKDRWGGTPLDDALRGGTLYHLYCAKLIHGWGGELGTLAGTEEGEQKLKELESVSIKGVRLVIRDLIEKGHDKQVPKRTTEEELLIAREASMQVLDCTHKLRKAMDVVNGQVSELALKIRGEGKALRDQVSRLTAVIGAQDMKGLVATSYLKESREPRVSMDADTGSAFSALVTSAYDTDPPSPPADGREGSTSLVRYCQRQLAALDRDDAEGNLDQGFQDLDEGDLDMGLDTDEELQLHAEIDALLEAQERSHVAGLSGEKLAAKTFQRVAIHLVQHESAFETLASFTHIGRAKRGIKASKSAVISRLSSLGNDTWEPSLEAEDIGWLLSQLHATSTVDVNEIFEEATTRDANSILPYNSLSRRDVVVDLSNDPHTMVPLSSLIAHSRSFRHAVQAMRTDHRVCAAMKTRLGRMLREQQVRELLTAANDVVVKKGETILDIAEGHEAERGRVSSKSWVVVLDGELKMSIATSKDPTKGKDDTSAPLVEEKLLGTGDFFGICTGVRRRGTKPTFRVVAMTGCQLVELPLANLAQFEEEDGVVNKLLRYTAEGSEDLGLPAPLKQHSSRTMVQNLRQTFTRGLSTTGFFKSSQNNLAVGRSPPPRNPAVRSPLRANKKDDVLIDKDAVGTGEGERSEMNEEERMEVQKMFNQIEEVWRCLAQGQQTLSIGQIRGISRHLGEVGSELFKELFHSPKRHYSEAMTEANFWELWVSFFREEVFGNDKQQSQNRRKSLMLDPDLLDQLQKEEELEALRSMEEEEALLVEDEPDSWFERLHSRFAPGRKLRHRFFEDEVIEHYEKAYIQVVGNLNDSLDLKHIPPFLLHVIVDYPYKVSQYNVREFMDVFLREKAQDAKFITWNDIAKILRERRMGLWAEGEGSRTMIGTTFHPHTSYMRRWHVLVRLVSIYHFILVPVRASFTPWDSMTSTMALATDLPADIITFLHLFVCTSTAYKNSKSVWVTSRVKLLRKINVHVLIAAIPLDWFAHFSGANNEAACILRINKMFLLAGTLAKAKYNNNNKSNHRVVIKMFALVTCTLHLSACIWFFIGSHYHYWVPSHRAVSWLTVSDELAHTTYDRDDHFAMEPEATTWEEYLLSLYWVAATLTVNGLTGDLLPQNPLEIVFTIILMALNMTMVRWIIGEVSTIVMNSDKEIVKSREVLEAVDQFLSGNALPEELQKEIRAHFLTIQAGSVVDQTEVMSGMSYSLKVEVAALTSREYLEGVDLLAGCSPRLLESVSVLLSEHLYAPEETLFYAGAAAKEMYFVVSGVVEELMENDEGEEVIDAIRRAHHSVGSIPFCFGLRHFNSARASKHGGCVVLRLEREQFFDLLKLYPADEETISNNAMATLDAIKSKAGSSRRGSSRAGGSVVSSRSGISAGSVPGQAGPGEVAAAGEEIVKLGSEKEKDIDTESGGKGSAGASDDLEALVGSNMKEKISALKNRRKRERVNLLLTAAMQGDVGKLKGLVEGGSVSVNAMDPNKRTPLHIAASEGHTEMVKALLEMRADVTLKDTFGNTPFNDAVREKRDQVVMLLREANQSVMLSLPGCAAAVMMCEEAHKGNMAQIRRLVENGVSVNDADYDGRTALHLAVCEGHEEVVLYLLERKADVNCKDRFGGTPMEDAIRHDREAVQKILMDRGATLEGGGSGFAGKMCQMASEGNTHGVRTLRRNGFDVTEGDYDRRTALHLAACNDRVSVLEYLLGLDPPINVNLVDRFGGTPLDDAHRHGSTAAIAMLMKRGCVTSDNPALPDILEANRQVEEERGKLRRREPVRNKVKHSPEGAALALVENTIMPEMRTRGQVLSAALLEMMRRVEAAINFAAVHQTRRSTSASFNGSFNGNGNGNGNPVIVSNSVSLLPAARASDSLPVQMSLPGQLGMDHVLERIESDHNAEQMARLESAENSAETEEAELARVVSDQPSQLSSSPSLGHAFSDPPQHTERGKGRWQVGVLIPGDEALPVQGSTALIRGKEAAVVAGSPAQGVALPFKLATEDLPQYTSITEAAEDLIEQGKEVRAAGVELKNLLRFELDINSTSTPIDCLTWKVLKRNYEKEVTAVFAQIRRSKEVSGIARKLMKGVLKVEKRRAQMRGEDQHGRTTSF